MISSCTRVQAGVYAHRVKVTISLDIVWNDGDKVSFNIMHSQEALEEAKNFLNSKQAYINISGKLKYGVNNSISTLVLYNMTRGLEVA